MFLPMTEIIIREISVKNCCFRLDFHSNIILIIKECLGIEKIITSGNSTR